jgi:hypothetical protein
MQPFFFPCRARVDLSSGSHFCENLPYTLYPDPCLSADNVHALIPGYFHRVRLHRYERHIISDYSVRFHSAITIYNDGMLQESRSWPNLHEDAAVDHRYWDGAVRPAVC